MKNICYVLHSLIVKRIIFAKINKKSIMNTKNIFRIALICVILAAVTALTGCKKNETVSYPYAVGIMDLSASNFTDLGIITSYLETKGLKNNDVITGRGKDAAEADADAKSQFAKKKALLVYSEVAELGLDPKTTFSYSISRYANPEDPNSEVISIDSWYYPEK